MMDLHFENGSAFKHVKLSVANLKYTEEKGGQNTSSELTCQTWP